MNDFFIDIARLQFINDTEIICEPPNKDLYKFDGRM